MLQPIIDVYCMKMEKYGNFEYNRLASERLFNQEPNEYIRMERLAHDMRTQADTLTEEDGIEVAFYRAALERLDTDEDFRGLMLDFLRHRPELAPSHERYLPLRCFQKFAIRWNPQYHKGFDSKQWKNLIKDTLSDEHARAELEHDLFNRHLQTNVADRYKSVPPLIGWLRENQRVGERVSILDIGSSVNHGLKKLSLMDILPGELFSPTRAFLPADSVRPWKDFSESEELTDRINTLQNTPVGLSVGVGIDREDMSTPDNEEWARACLTPREHQDGTVDNHDKLDMIRPPNVRFVKRDLLNPDESRDLHGSPEDNPFFDVVTIFTVMNQLSPSDRYRLTSIARRHVKETGLLVIQDFARVNPDLDIEIDFLFQDWNRHFSYRTIVMDMQERGRYQEAMLFDGGRCKAFQPALGRFALGQSGRRDGIISFAEFLRT